MGERVLADCMWRGVRLGELPACMGRGVRLGVLPRCVSRQGAGMFLVESMTQASMVPASLWGHEGTGSTFGVWDFRPGWSVGSGGLDLWGVGISWDWLDTGRRRWGWGQERCLHASLLGRVSSRPKDAVAPRPAHLLLDQLRAGKQEVPVAVSKATPDWVCMQNYAKPVAAYFAA